MGTVDERNINLVFPEDFDQRFLEMTREADTYEAAYDAVEQEYFEMFGRRRYASYDSYRITRAKRIKR